MPETSISFSWAMGGRPKGSRGSPNDWLSKGRRAAEVGRRIDKVQSNLLTKMRSIGLFKLAAFAKILRMRLDAHHRRSKHTRSVHQVQGFQRVFPASAKFP